VRALPRVVLVALSEGDSASGLARALRDEGVEVVHAGRLASAEQVLRTVEQEDPDALGLVLSADGTAGDAALAASVARETARSAPEVGVFGWGCSPDAVVPNAFETPREVTEWLSGVRTHTPETPSDRIR
jgi:methylmalonyl-CoA mutase C-terminal domain/subunit